MLRALASVRDPKRQVTALGLMLDDRLDARETLQMLSAGSAAGARRCGDDANLDVSQTLFREHQAAIMKDHAAGRHRPGVRPVQRAVHPRSATRISARGRRLREADVLEPGRAATRIIAQNLDQMVNASRAARSSSPRSRAWLTGAKMPSPPKTPRSTDVRFQLMKLVPLGAVVFDRCRGRSRLGGISSPAGVAAAGLAVRVPQRTHVRARETTKPHRARRVGFGQREDCLSTARPIGEPARGPRALHPTAASSNPSSSLRRGTSCPLRGFTDRCFIRWKRPHRRSFLRGDVTGPGVLAHNVSS